MTKLEEMAIREAKDILEGCHTALCALPGGVGKDGDVAEIRNGVGKAKWWLDAVLKSGEKQ